MKPVPDEQHAEDQATLQFLGQAGYLVHAYGLTLIIDPYLSDFAAKLQSNLARILPVPMEPQALEADLFVVTHDHLDHLDPDTIGLYQHKVSTAFIGPRLVCARLKSLDVHVENITCVDVGAEEIVRGVVIRGVYTIPSEKAVEDTAGYCIEFPNGRRLYHTSDTAFSQALLDSVPRAEVLLACINGKFGNMDPDQAARVAAAVSPRVAIPNH